MSGGFGAKEKSNWSELKKVRNVKECTSPDAGVGSSRRGVFAIALQQYWISVGYQTYF